MSHVIRLGFPWQITNTTASLLEFSRIFHRPTGIKIGQEIWLVVACTETAKLKEVRLNGQVIATSDDSRTKRRIAIGQLLQASSNRLTLSFGTFEKNTEDSIAPLKVAAAPGPLCSRPDRVDVSEWTNVCLEIDALD